MQRQRIASLLPVVFQRTLPEAFWRSSSAEVGDSGRADAPLPALLALMEALHEPAEKVLAQLDAYFHAYDAPEPFVYYLASWLALEPLFQEHPNDTEYFFAGGLGRLRELVAGAVALSGRRGTHAGLCRLLGIATGVPGFTVHEDEHVPFHVRVGYPPEAGRFLPFLRTIIEMEKPAYVTYDLFPQEAPGADEEE